MLEQHDCERKWHNTTSRREVTRRRKGCHRAMKIISCDIVLSITSKRRRWIMGKQQTDRLRWIITLLAKKTRCKFGNVVISNYVLRERVIADGKSTQLQGVLTCHIGLKRPYFGHLNMETLDTLSRKPLK